MKKYLLILITVVLTSSLTLLFTAFKPEPDKSLEITEHIQLYSNGRLIGEWEAVGRGKMEGDTYVFKTSSGAFSKEVRIKGDFVVETSPN